MAATTTVISPSSTDRGRMYPTPYGMLPGVTNVLNVIGKPALIHWAARTEREYVIEVSADLYEDAPPPPAPRMSRLVYKTTLAQRLGAKKAHERQSEKAKDSGSQAHKLIEWNLRREMGMEVGPEPRIGQEAATAYASYQDWRVGIDLHPLHIEQVVYHRAGYAGTLDMVSRAKDGSLEVTDFKTSSGIYPEYILQLVAYAKAVEDMGHGKPERVRVLRIPKTGGAVEERVVERADFGRHFEAFLCALTLWKWQEAERRD